MTPETSTQIWDLSDDTQAILTVRGGEYYIEIVRGHVGILLIRPEMIILNDVIHYAVTATKTAGGAS